MRVLIERERETVLKPFQSIDDQVSDHRTDQTKDFLSSSSLPGIVFQRKAHRKKDDKKDFRGRRGGRESSPGKKIVKCHDDCRGRTRDKSE